MNSRSSVLIIDDDIMQRKLIAMIAQKAGIDAIEAESMEQAEKYLQKNDVSYVTLDLGLGKDNGTLLLRIISRLCPSARVIIISGAGDDTLATAENVANDALIDLSVMRKPLKIAELKKFFEQPPNTRDILRARIGQSVGIGWQS